MNRQIAANRPADSKNLYLKYFIGMDFSRVKSLFDDVYIVLALVIRDDSTRLLRAHVDEVFVASVIGNETTAVFTHIAVALLFEGASCTKRKSIGVPFVHARRPFHLAIVQYFIAYIEHLARTDGAAEVDMTYAKAPGV